MSRLLVLLVLVALAATACGGAEEGSVSSPPTLPSAALPDLDSRARTLDADAVAADSLQPEPLAELLDEAGFVSGSEREFSGKTKTFDHVVARSLRFADAAGAERYLGWFQAHPDDFLGRSEPAKVATPGESGVVFMLARCGTCKKELPTFLGGWRRGPTVLTLLGSGSGANAERFSALVRQLDETVG